MNKELQNHNWKHYLQGSTWAEIKSTASWRTRSVPIDVSKGVDSLILYSRTIPALGRLHYVPKLHGLKQEDVPKFTSEIKKNIRRGVAIKLELDDPYSEELNQTLLENGWQPGGAEQYEYTVIVDLDKSIEGVKASFKKRARWEMSAAERRGVTVEKVPVNSENMQIFFDMMSITSARGSFRVRGKKFSVKYWEAYSKKGTGFLYFARHENDILSAAFVIIEGSRGFYKDGASLRLKSNLFASRLMHWQIIQDLKKAGLDSYDMCGVYKGAKSDYKNNGIYLFKTAFADSIKLQGGYVLPLSKTHRIWSRTEPYFLKIYTKLNGDIWY